MRSAEAALLALALAFTSNAISQSASSQSKLNIEPQPPTTKQFLREHGVETTPESLTAALNNPDGEVRGIAAAELANKNIAASIPNLKESLAKENDAFARHLMRSALFRLSPADGESFMKQLPQESTASDRVAAILDKILKRGEGSIGNIKTTTWVPPSQEDIERIREIGQSAIPPLDRALDSHRPFEQLLAVRLLGAIGGANVVGPLNRALGSGKANSVRVAALWALRSAPVDLAIPIIQSAVGDPDPLVARHAREVLTDYYQVEVPK